MKILAVDDEKFALLSLTDAIKEAAPDAELHAFSSANEALSCASKISFDVAFLDVRLRGMTGLEMALALKKINPRINIIFATGYDEYLMSATRQHCSGYLLKPIQAKDVKEELLNLRFIPQAKKRIHAQTFGNFELFVDGKAVEFESARSKELLAYLVDRRGAAAANAEIAAVIWEGYDNISSVQAQVRKAKASLIKTLKAAGIMQIFHEDSRNMSVVPDEMSCDYWLLLDGDVSALNDFTGEYMSGYSWGELTLGWLMRNQK